MPCNELFGLLGENSANVVFADPPYGIAYQSARRTDKQRWKPKIKNDERPYTEWLAPAFNSLREGGRLICFYRWDVQDEFIAAIEGAGFDIKSQIVWDKVIHGMGDLKGEHAPQHELAFYATKGRYEFAGKRPKTIYRHSRINGNDLIHPNEKPIPLITEMLSDISTKNDKIIDPFGGSFSTAIACKILGNSIDTSEIDDYYFDIGKARFDTMFNDCPILDKTDYSTLNVGLFA